LRELPRVALAAGVAVLVIFIPHLPVLAQVTLATVVYAAIVLATGAVPDELLIELRRPFAARLRDSTPA
jgi:hypothetical protein